MVRKVTKENLSLKFVKERLMTASDGAVDLGTISILAQDIG